MSINNNTKSKRRDKNIIALKTNKSFGIKNNKKNQNEMIRKITPINIKNIITFKMKTGVFSLISLSEKENLTNKPNDRTREIKNKNILYIKNDIS